jgi:hypothetical protein
MCIYKVRLEQTCACLHLIHVGPSSSPMLDPSLVGADPKSMLNMHLQNCGSPSSVSLEDSDDQKPRSSHSGMQMNSPTMTGSEAQALLSAMSLSPPVPLIQHNPKRQLTMLAGTGEYDHGNSVYQQYLQVGSAQG